MACEAPGRHIWFVRTGILRLQRDSPDGRRQILDLRLPGDLCGYDTRLRPGMSVVAATSCRLCRIDRPKFDALMRDDSDLRRDFRLQQQRQLDRLRWLTWLIGALRPSDRIGTFLALARRFMPYQPLDDGGGILTMQLTRSDMADLLGTTIETISRVTHRLAEMQVIEILDPTHFRLHNLESLSAGALGENVVDGFPRAPGLEPTRLNALMGLAGRPERIGT